MNRIFSTIRSINWTSELTAAIVLLLVALPLNIGVALASGVSAESGIISGFIGSVVTGMLSGNCLQVSGPDAGIGILILEMIRSFGIHSLGPIVLIAGFFQLIASLTRSGKWFKAVSPALVNGMLAGMGILIIVTQFHIMLDDSPKETGLINLIMIPVAIYEGLWPLDMSTHHLAAFVGTVTILSAVLWEKLAVHRLKFIPPALISIALASILVYFGKWPVQLVELPESLFSSIGLINWSELSEAIYNPSLLMAAFMLAFIASAQSLITSSALDSMSRMTKTNSDRELLAQGIGNMLCGLIGVLPIAGVLVRSVANCQFGAKTRVSNIGHGILMVTTIILIPKYVMLIPTAALAAILVLVGFKMVRGIMVTVKAYEKGELFIFYSTTIAVIVTNLFTGLVIGFVLATFKLLYKLTDLNVHMESKDARGITVMHLSGAATFLQLPKLSGALDSLPSEIDLHLRLDKLAYIDHACLELIGKWEEEHKSAGGQVTVDWGRSEMTKYVLHTENDHESLVLSSSTSEQTQPPSQCVCQERERDRSIYLLTGEATGGITGDVTGDVTGEGELLMKKLFEQANITDLSSKTAPSSYRVLIPVKSVEQISEMAGYLSALAPDSGTENEYRFLLVAKDRFDDSIPFSALKARQMLRDNERNRFQLLQSIKEYGKNIEHLFEGVKISYSVHNGDPCREILKEADVFQASLIVLLVSESRGLFDFLRRSLSGRLLNRCKIPVQIVKRDSLKEFTAKTDQKTEQGEQHLVLESNSRT